MYEKGTCAISLAGQDIPGETVRVCGPHWGPNQGGATPNTEAPANTGPWDPSVHSQGEH